jgi:RimJ/RimL family protein N-acetyltransferase
VVLEGRYVRLEPIGRAHAADLFAAMAGPALEQRFDWLSEYQPASEAELGERLVAAAAKADPMMWAVIDGTSGRAEGRQCLMRIVPQHGVIEIGNVYWGPRMARTRLATEALALHARYVFETLGYRRFEWKCNARNAASQAAARRFGFVPEGVFRQHMIVKGANRDTAWFAMLDSDWARLRGEYARWLDPANFAADGTQLTPLRFSP